MSGIEELRADQRWVLLKFDIIGDRWERRFSSGDLTCHLRCEHVFKTKGRWRERVGFGRNVWVWELVRTGWSITAGRAVSLAQALADANAAFEAAEAAYRFSGRVPDYLNQD